MDNNQNREIAINISGVKKMYKLGQIGGGTLQADLQSWWAKKRGKEDPNTKIGQKERLVGQTFMALNGVDITIYQGEAVGIIGGNGAGKSTLLKLLSQVTAPTEGKIELNGRVASMLEVGTGFNGEMTGRENVYMNGAILGMTKAEIDAKMEDIIEFSEVRDFIDTPVKRYSSGMYVKLAFSVAAHLDSEIMIMDEVLAVGDMAFQKKCLDKMRDAAKQEGRTVLYVSHNMNTIRQLCDRCIVLDKGKVIFEGDVESAISVYMNVKKYDSDRTSYIYEPSEHNLNNKDNVKLHGLDMIGVENNKFRIGEDINFILHCKVNKPINDVKIRFEMYFSDNAVIGTTFSDKSVDFTNIGYTDLVMRLPTKNLAPGKYYANALLFEYDERGNERPIDRVEPAISFGMYNSDKNGILWLHPWWGHIRLDDMIIEDIK